MKNLRMKLFAILTLTMSLTVGCSDPLGSDDESENIDFRGNYLVEGTWDLSSPLSSQRTLGDSFAELLTREIVASAGVPGVAEEEAQELVLELIGDDIRNGVDSRSPDHLDRNSDLMQELAQTLGSVRVVSEVELGEGGILDDVGGLENIQTFEFTKGQEVHVLTPELLKEMGAPDIAMQTDWEGTQTGDTLEIDDHTFSLQYGDLVAWTVLNVIGSDANSLNAATSAAVECDVLMQDISGEDGGFFLSVADEEYGLTAIALASACDGALAKLTEKAIGVFAIDAKVTAGGNVLLLDDDGDGVADRLQSHDNFGGFIGVLPEAIAPRLGVDFEATRIER